MADNKTVKRRRKRLTMATKEKLKGLLFVSPFIVGCCAFFLYPIILSFLLSFGDVTNIIGFQIELYGLDNYSNAFFQDTEFMPKFYEVVGNTFIEFPLKLIAALIIAIMVNKDIKGKSLFRIAFFIPFLLGSGEVMNQLLNQGVDRQVLSVADGKIIPYNVLMYFGGNIMETVSTIFGKIVTVLWGSGVQILLFLSGLQSISPALYEAARIDGATEWEIFWKVTIPMISPMLLLNFVYTIVDGFTNMQNPLLAYIQQKGFKEAKFGFGAAMGWIYFLFIGVLVAIVFAIMKKYMHTNEAEEVKKRRDKSKRIFTIERTKNRF